MVHRNTTNESIRMTSAARNPITFEMPETLTKIQEANTKPEKKKMENIDTYNYQ